MYALWICDLLDVLHCLCLGYPIMCLSFGITRDGNIRRKEVSAMVFQPKQAGQGLVEYALILVLIAVVVIVILALLGPAIGNVFSNIIGNL